MNKEEKLKKINEATEQNLTMEYIEKGAEEYGVTTDVMLNLMLEDIKDNTQEVKKPMNDTNKIFFGVTIGLLFGFMVMILPLDIYWRRLISLGLVFIAGAIYGKDYK